MPSMNGVVVGWGKTLVIYKLAINPVRSCLSICSFSINALLQLLSMRSYSTWMGIYSPVTGSQPDWLTDWQSTSAMTPQIAPHSLYVFIIWSSPSHPPEEKRRRHPIVELYPEIPTTLLLTYYSQAHTNSGEMSGNGTGWKRDCETRVPYYYSQCCMQKEEQTNVLTRFIARLIPLSGISFREIRGATPLHPCCCYYYANSISEWNELEYFANSRSQSCLCYCRSLLLLLNNSCERDPCTTTPLPPSHWLFMHRIMCTSAVMRKGRERNSWSCWLWRFTVVGSRVEEDEDENEARK